MNYDVNLDGTYAMDDRIEELEDTIDRLESTIEEMKVFLGGWMKANLELDDARDRCVDQSFKTIEAKLRLELKRDLARIV